MLRKQLLLVALLLAPLAGFAHVGSPDVYYDGYAGQYHLLVTIRPPSVIPGVAEIQVRSASSDVSQIEILPLRMVGPGADLAPRPDVAERSSADPQLYNGHLWMMDRGSWRVLVNVDGQHGKAQMAVPVPAVSMKSATMQKSLGGLLGILGFLLVAGFIGIVGAANREAKLDPDQDLTGSQKNRGMAAMIVTAFLLLAVLYYANRWWGVEASANSKLSYRLPHVEASLQAGTLQLHLSNPNEASGFTQFGTERADRLRLEDLVPDHGHLMHLFLVSTDMKSLWHLHPNQDQIGQFSEALPAIPAGHYRIYADIVHETGFPETEIGEIDLPAITGQNPTGDDSGGAALSVGDKISQLSGGYRMVWERDAAALKTKQPLWFRFRVEDQSGKPATDIEPYMGMAGHAAFIRDDGEVFAHVHPSGSVPMAAAERAQKGLASSNRGSDMDMTTMNHGTPSAEVSFPYGFSQPGDYHIYVQVKRAGRVETGAFTAHVEN